MRRRHRAQRVHQTILTAVVDGLGQVRRVRIDGVDRGRRIGMMSGTSKTTPRRVGMVTTMRLRPALIELVVSDMAATLALYRRLGLAIPPDADGAPHVDVEFEGLRIAFDTEETIRSFDPSWSPPGPGGHRVALAFDCGTPDDVDAAWADLTGAGYAGHLAPWNAFWGMRYAVIHDPDGTPVDLFALLPETEVP
jgi:catechol 2,3-dioxygenase-like lactoylglutathione lyase family enzyme